MTKAQANVVALIEGTEEDPGVVREAQALARSAGAGLVLLHVTSLIDFSIHANVLAGRKIEPWEQMQGIQATCEAQLDQLARQTLGGGCTAKTEVRFGDTVEELVRAASGATAVVAASRPAKLLPWRSRDSKIALAFAGSGSAVMLVGSAGKVSERHAIKEFQHSNSSFNTAAANLDLRVTRVVRERRVVLPRREP